MKVDVSYEEDCDILLLSIRGGLCICGIDPSVLVHFFLFEFNSNTNLCPHSDTFDVYFSPTEIDCGVPTVWPHSRMLWTKASQMGAKVFYECDVGYYNAGPENISVCTVDGVWSPPNVVCTGIGT